MIDADESRDAIEGRGRIVERRRSSIASQSSAAAIYLIARNTYDSGMNALLSAESSPLRTHLLPQLASRAAFVGGTVVVLDILRASTTIVHALANGATAVHPTATVEEALALKAARPNESWLLGGEREGVLIPGFDADNNPFAYSEGLVRGRRIAFTTSHGTAALRHAQAASRILIGSFVNLWAVIDRLVDDERPIHLVCAGTRGEVSLEDVACAGAIAVGLAERRGWSLDDWPDDSTQLAAALVRSRAADDAGRLQLVRASFGGRNCRRLGFDRQIERAASLDLFDFVPEYNGSTGELLRARS